MSCPHCQDPYPRVSYSRARNPITRLTFWMFRLEYLRCLECSHRFVIKRRRRFDRQHSVKSAGGHSRTRKTRSSSHV